MRPSNLGIISQARAVSLAVRVKLFFSSETGPGIFDWASFINVKDFYQKTYSHYFIYYCKIDHFDCREYFQTKETFNGVCVEFNPQNIAEKLRKMSKKAQMSFLRKLKEKCPFKH